jgi:phage shock protein C
MSSGSHTKFYLDKQNGKWAGVCAGIADYTGLDVTLVRMGFVIGTILGSGMLLLAYFIIAWMAPRKPVELYEESPERKKFWQGVRRSPRTTARDVRSRLRQIDRRLADTEAYLTSSHGRLAREIEQLR